MLLETAQEAWERLPAIERGKYLRQIAVGIRERADEIARTISEEMGKTLSLATVEVHFTADYLDYMAEWARRYEGEIIQSDRPNEHIFLYKKRLASPPAFYLGTSRSSSLPVKRLRH